MSGRGAAGTDPGPGSLPPAHRVLLRQPTEDDADELARASEHSRSLHHPWASPPQTPEGWRRLIGQTGHRKVMHVGCLRQGGAIVAVVTFSDIVRGAFQSASLGYEAFVPYAGKGLTRETLTLAMDWAFDDCGLHRVEANVQPGNTRSIGLVRRLGFREEGFSPRFLFLDGAWRDHERWALTVEEWRSPTPA